jgi:septum formation protein
MNGTTALRGLVLASASPRRRELLSRLGLVFEVVAPDVDETPLDGERPAELVRRLAVAKATVVDGAVVLAADTTVEADGEILGKPDDAADARRMLGLLAGRSHEVHTGVAVRAGERLEVELVTTTVTFTPISPRALEWYVGTGEPMDKAGGYAIQGAGGVFVDAVHGSVSNVVGLPLATVARLLQTLTAWQPGA